MPPKLTSETRTGTQQYYMLTNTRDTKISLPYYKDYFKYTVICGEKVKTE